MDQLTNELSAHAAQAIVIGCLVVVGIGVFLGFRQKATIFSDFDDLGLSLGVFAVPLATSWALSMFLATKVTAFIGGFLLVLLLGIVAVRTYKSNDGRLGVALIALVTKLVLSFLYVLHVYQLFTAKDARSRRGAGFFVLVFSPILVALVKEKEGLFSISSRGRPSIRTGGSSTNKGGSNRDAA